MVGAFGMSRSTCSMTCSLVVLRFSDTVCTNMLPCAPDTVSEIIGSTLMCPSAPLARSFSLAIALDV